MDKRIFIIGSTLILLAIPVTHAESRSENFINVHFLVDGVAADCDGFEVELRLNSESFRPKHIGQSFEVPDAFKRPIGSWRDNQRVDISLTCSGYTLDFPNQHPAFVHANDWTLGIAHPIYAVERYGYTHEFDRGALLDYLIFEGEPGVITFSSEAVPPIGMSDSLQKEAPATSGRARDIAYVLAVFNVDYAKNRDRLWSVLRGCLSRPKESPEDDLCDRDLLSFVTNLYWRGDETLLLPLVHLAEDRGDVIGGIGGFYADLLDRRGEVALRVMARLPADKQQLVCKLAYDDDLSFDSPKRDRIASFLRKVSSDPASRCLAALENR